MVKSNSKIFAFAIILILLQNISTKTSTFSVYYDSVSSKYTVKEGLDLENRPVATANYEASLETTGWDKLYLQTFSDYSDEILAYGAGYLEGAITTERIYNHWVNLNKETWGKEGMPENVLKYIKENDEFTRNYKKDDYINNEYDSAVVLTYKQLLGLLDGYNDHTTFKKLTIVELQTINAFGDMEDITQFENPTDFENQPESFFVKYVRDNTHCSAFFKLKEDFSDLYFGHNSWFMYSAQIRIFKTYKYTFASIKSGPQWVSFSSYPGTLASNDDFYVLENNLIVIETTNPVFNNDLFLKLNPKSILTWHRTVVSNLISKNSREWAINFGYYNSGTYNNQFMILDANKIDLEKKEVNDEALFIVEQIPDFTDIIDVTEYLRMGYWPSFNVPFSHKIREMSKYHHFEKKFSNLNSTLNYYTNSRAEIFRRDAGNVHNFNDFKKFMRYNDYKNDPLSLGVPSFTISARYDLSDDPELVSCKGAYDAKIGSLKTIKEKGVIEIISGPTYDDQPVFNWTKSEVCKNTSRVGMPDEMKFDWIEFKLAPNNPENIISEHSNSKQEKNPKFMEN